MSAAPTEFELAGDNGIPLRFRVARLKVRDALRVGKLISKVLLPAIGEAANAPEGAIGDAMTKLVEGLDCLPELLDGFLPVTQVPSPTNPEAWMAFGPMLETLFVGRTDLTVQFLAKCVEAEYGRCLKEGPLAALVGKLAAKFSTMKVA